jgi:pyrroline-5-carboxylate reductase
MSLQNKTIAFIGAGNMAEALIRGLLGGKTVTPEQVVAMDVSAERREYIAKTFGIAAGADNAAAAKVADIIILAVKPQQMKAVLTELKPEISELKLLISIAAGVTTQRMEEALGGQPRVVRVMPNTPALIGAGAAGMARGRFASEEDLAASETILSAVGICVRVEESLLDAVTALSGSGPAYVFYVAEAMIEAAVAAGLDRELAKKLAVQTVWGAGTLMAATGEEPAVLREKVTSPGGTTEAALKVMGERKLAGIFAEAIQAATQRSKELSVG